MKTFLSLLLVLCMFASLAACTQEGSSSQESRESTSEIPDDGVWHAGLDFGGQKLIVSMSTNVWDPTTSLASQSKYTVGPEEIGSDNVLNACYARNRAVASALDVTISYQETNFIYKEINPYIDTAATMAKAPADLIVNDIYAVTPAMLKGQLYNLKDNAEQNYFNFEHSSWYPDFINGLTYDSSRVYAAVGDYFIDVIRSSHVLYVNTEIFQVQLSDYYPEMKDFYNMILDGDWDYDEFMLLIQNGWKSTSGQPTASIEDEYIGFLAHTNSYGPVYSSNVSMVEKTSEGYQMKVSTTQLQEFAEAFSELYHTDGVYTVSDNNGTGKMKFVDGQILFLADCWLGDLEFPAMYAMEKKAPVVYPKWNDSATYKTWVHDSAEIGYILTNTANFTPTSAYLELLNEESEPIMTQYFEYALKYGKNTDADAIKMLDLIREVVMPPFEQYLSGVSIAHLVNPVIKSGNPAAIPTDYSSNLPTYSQTLADKLAKFYALED